MRTEKERQIPNPDRSRIGAPTKRPPPTATRAAISPSSIDLWGWPSRGGLIVLRRTTSLDFQFLGLDAADLSTYAHRNADQDLEDIFCQRLLLLGAKWFDSHDRYAFVCGVEEDLDVEIQAIENDEEPAPTRMERRWVSAAWLPDEKGFWIAEFETTMRGWQERENLPPDGAARAALASNMEQKVKILKELGGRFFERLEDYEGGACVNAWEVKETGEHGPLVLTSYEAH